MLSKRDNFLIFAIGCLIFAGSYLLDGLISSTLAHIRTAFLDFSLSLIENIGLMILFMLVLPFFFLYKKDRHSSYSLVIAFLLSFAFSFITKIIIARDRPIENLLYPFTGITSYSFPSMHAMIAFSLMSVLVFKMPRKKALWISYACLIAFSRVYFGFHFMSDVVFGAFAGYFIGILAIYVTEKWR